MACFGRDGKGGRKAGTGCFERASPALKEILLKLYRAGKPMEVDHHLYEFGSVEYHIKSSASDPQIIYLSISMPLLFQGTVKSDGIPQHTIQRVKNISPEVVEIMNPTKEGYQLTLQLNFAHIPRGKGGIKVITEIATVQSVILSSQLKEILRNFSLQEVSQGTYKPIKLVYHPREPFFIIRQPHKITAVFPMRFREPSDVIIATSFFQELMDVGSSDAWAKAPPCTWSPIPPPELRGEPIEDLSTNGGFVSFDIFSHHVDDKRLENTVWNLLNFYAYVKSHVKCTRGYIQRRMRRRLDDLVKVLHETKLDEDDQAEKAPGCGCTVELVRFSRLKMLRRRYNDFNRKIKRSRCRIRIHGFSHFNRRWFPIPKFSCARYAKLE
ncbi:hypothetical protein Ancab_013061 [Ancistrocladus abbreviatus]